MLWNHDVSGRGDDDDDFLAKLFAKAHHWLLMRVESNSRTIERLSCTGAVAHDDCQQSITHLCGLGQGLIELMLVVPLEILPSVVQPVIHGEHVFRTRVYVSASASG